MPAGINGGKRLWSSFKVMTWHLEASTTRELVDPGLEPLTSSTFTELGRSFAHEIIVESNEICIQNPSGE